MEWGDSQRKKCYSLHNQFSDTLCNTILMKATDSCRSTTVNPAPHLFIQVYQGLIGQFQGLDGLQDCVPVTAVDVGHEALYAVHRVQGHRGLFLQGGQGPLQVVLLQVLHDQTDHAKRKQNNTTKLRSVHG